MPTDGTLRVTTPVDGSEIAMVPMHTVADAKAAIAKGVTAFEAWRKVPAPRRGELVRLLGEELRCEKEDLGRLLTLEFGKIYQEGPDVPDGLIQSLIGDRDLGEVFTNSPDVAMISATGSVPIGKSVAETMSKCLGKTILKLGGNNAIIVAPSADLEMAVWAIVFSAVGTTGSAARHCVV